jgi:hypothetical protein
MNTARAIILTLTVCLLWTTPAAADAITFDDIQAPAQGWTDVPEDYAGVQWDGFQTISNDYYRSAYRNRYDFPSNDMAAYNGDGALEVSLSRSDAFDLGAASFGGWTAFNNQPYYTAESITLQGYLDGSKTGEQTLQLSFGAFEEFDLSSFQNIDELKILSDGEENYWLMDNVEIEDPAGGGQTGGAVAPTPIPATAWLLGAGVATLAGVRRKTRRKASGVI